MLPLQVLTDGYVLSNTTGTTVQQYAPPYDSGIHHRVGGSGLVQRFTPPCVACVGAISIVNANQPPGGASVWVVGCRNVPI